MAQFDKQNGRCYYTGILMTVGGGDGSRLERASLDRIDPKKGYVVENVVFCCWVVNSMKNNLPLTDFLEWVARVHKARA